VVVAAVGDHRKRGVGVAVRAGRAAV
jgi:hypothetical protein